MLLSWRNRVRIGLCPTQIGLVPYARGWRPQAGEPRVFTFEPIPEAPAWQAPVAALRHWLEESKPGPAAIELVLSDRFCRYAVIPWSEEVTQPAEELALTRLVFEKDYGEAAACWAIRMDREEYGKTAIACAFDQAFFDAIETLLREHGHRLASLRPQLAAVFNRARGHLGSGETLLAVVEAGHCVLATFGQGEWHSARSLCLPQRPNGAALGQLIERECLLQGLGEAARIYVYSPEAGEAAALAAELQATLLEKPRLPDGHGAPSLAMAFCGAG